MPRSDREAIHAVPPCLRRSVLEVRGAPAVQHRGRRPVASEAPAGGRRGLVLTGPLDVAEVRIAKREGLAKLAPLTEEFC